VVKVDYHVHSDWSPDSRMSVKKALDGCIQNDIKEIVFTEHLDVGDPGQLPLIDLKAYREELQSARRAYPNLSIGIGLELGVHQGNLLETQSYIAPYAWDFLILSVHQINDIGCCNPSLMELYDTPTILNSYWEAWYYLVEHFSNFHVLGHLDYLLRYQPIDEDEFIQWDDRKDHMLQLLVKHGQGIEINAKGISSLGRPHPPMAVLKRFKELGGEIVTLGSDAHSTKTIGKHFETMLAYLQACGFDYYARRDFERKTFYFEKTG
jgi:histidinol-phosphatase (PHP family)